MIQVTAAQAQANLQNVVDGYEADDFSFADFMCESVSEECHVLHQALVNLEERENQQRAEIEASAAMEAYWAGTVSGSLNAYVEKHGYGETIYAG